MRTTGAFRSFAVLVFVALAACSKSGSGETALGSPGVILGSWESEPTLSQLGMLVHRYEFAADGTFTGSVEFLQAKVPRMTGTGTYDTAHRVLRAAGGSEMTYEFDGDVLVLREKNGDSYRLKKK